MGGFAAADALRGVGGSAPSAQTTTARTTTTAPVVTAEVEPAPPPPPGPKNFPRGVLSGSLVFTDAQDCRVRQLLLAQARERELPGLRGWCELWAPRRGPVIARGIGNVQRDAVPFALVELDTRRYIRGDSALFGFLTWSFDGRRAAWCNQRGEGREFVLGRGVRRLDECPNAYTTTGELVYALGHRLAIGQNVLVTTPGTITYVVTTRDGALVLQIEGRRLQVYRDAGAARPFARLQEDMYLDEDIEGRIPIVSPNACAAVFRSPGDGGDPPAVALVDLGCLGVQGRRIFGTNAVWSPDGKWLAVTEPAAIAFHEIGGRGRVLRWPASAAAFAWRE